MPATYRIDRARKLVLASGSGVLTIDEMLDAQGRIKSDPDFDPSYNQLIDFTDVEEMRISAEDVRQLAYGSPFREGSRRAIVVDRPAYFGLARVFQALTESHGPELRIFYELAEARRWLQLGA